jgi:hypothetical protein
LIPRNLAADLLGAYVVGKLCRNAHILYPSKGSAVIEVTVPNNNFIKADQALELGLIDAIADDATALRFAARLLVFAGDRRWGLIRSPTQNGTITVS